MLTRVGPNAMLVPPHLRGLLFCLQRNGKALAPSAPSHITFLLLNSMCCAVLCFARRRSLVVISLAYAMHSHIYTYVVLV